MFRPSDFGRFSPFRAGNAGLIASFAIALAGVIVGAVSAYVSENGAIAEAARTEAADVNLREGNSLDAAWVERQKIIRQVLTGADLERLPVPEFTARNASRPKIVIVFDDMGIDRRASEAAMSLPGPLTFSFLPYARDVDEQAQQALARGAETMLHLPMEPQGEDDPGPHVLKTNMTGAKFLKELDWNLSRFEGYSGVNNHMGSKLTTAEAEMKTLLAYLESKNLYFMDSVTTGDTIVRQAAASVGANVFARDVFLDAEAGNPEAVRRQLALVERIARETGYAVAICHPHKETLEVIGPWLTTAPARGFDLVTASAILDIEFEEKPPIVAEAPALRL